ncbi:hypothetical protein Nepgr_029701 [Nepenthes gracilis]|uniref:Uncharacterized protein n=1 Tax=Nepenthes gracilis TaxID=150966 RepID=A0AAD3TCY6_NEPGR|nr:hypothetical protein Nepgr_029701 [Nepenthes gracilis]
MAPDSSPTPSGPSSVSSPLPTAAPSTDSFIHGAQISPFFVSGSPRPSPPHAAWQSPSSSSFSPNHLPPSLSELDFLPICASRLFGPESRVPVASSALSSHVGVASSDSPPLPMFQSDFTKLLVCLDPLPSSAPPFGHILAQSVTHSVSMAPPDCFTHINLDDPCPVDGLSAVGSICSLSRIGASDCRDHLCCRVESTLSSDDPPSGLLNQSDDPVPVSGSETQVETLSPGADPGTSMGFVVPCQSARPLELHAVPPPCIGGAVSNRTSASCPSDEPAPCHPGPGTMCWNHCSVSVKVHDAGSGLAAGFELENSDPL